MAVLALRIEGDGLPRFAEAAQTLGSRKKATRAFRRGVNHVGKKGFTQVKRALAPQVGLSQTKLVRLGHVRTARAGDANLRFVIESTGNALSLKEFGARQFSYGVRAKPWGRSQKFASAFIFAGHPKSGIPVAGGHVFTNTRGWNKKQQRYNAIEKKWGPSIPKEMVKGESRAAFEKTAGQLGPRIRHEISALTRGVVS